jgi:hypothetical protein
VTFYHPDRIELGAAVSGEAYLVVANTWSPFWIASVDGRAEKLTRSNHAQFGLALGPGKHQIILRYRPPYVFGSSRPERPATAAAR